MPKANVHTLRAWYVRLRCSRGSVLSAPRLSLSLSLSRLLTLAFRRATTQVPAITHPDSFATGDYGGRIQLDDGTWGDKWVQNTASWIHYNFSTTMSTTTGLPLRDCGPTTPTPPYAYACTHHHHVRVAEEYEDWDAFFSSLDTTTCTPSDSRFSSERDIPNLHIGGATSWVRFEGK